MKPKSSVKDYLFNACINSVKQANIDGNFPEGILDTISTTPTKLLSKIDAEIGLMAQFLPLAGDTRTKVEVTMHDPYICRTCGGWRGNGGSARLCCSSSRRGISGFGSRGVNLRISYGGRNFRTDKAIVSGYELGVLNEWV
jgi:hypothetical protein